MIPLEQYNSESLIKSADAPIWITDDETLAQKCEQWSHCPLIALDTEFIRTKTFYPIPGLIQLADDRFCYLIDPLAINDWNPLRRLLINPDVLKLFHAPSEDIELFRHSYQVVPQPLFDTQIAAAFAGWGHSRGLQKLLKLVLDVDLDKEETRSDWLQRPLTAKQERYAALDVAHLVELYRRIQAKLVDNGRGPWASEETSQMVANVANAEAEVDTYYQRFTQLANLAPHRQTALRDVCAWRERVVREEDRTRNSLLSNHLIVEVFKRWTKSLKDFSEIKEMRGSVVGTYGMTIVTMLREARTSHKVNPAPPMPKPLDFKWHSAVKQLRKFGQQVCEEQDIPPELLLRKRDIEDLIRAFDEGVEGDSILPPSLQGWRKSLIGEPLAAELQRIIEGRSE